jgi:hypothetical protein
VLVFNEYNCVTLFFIIPEINIMKPHKLIMSLISGIIATLLLQMPEICLGQDSIKTVKILVLENPLTNHIKNYPDHVVFKKGNRVKLICEKCDAFVIGRIKLIEDSAITIKDKRFKLNEIIRISRYRGIEPLIIGVTMVVGGAIVASYFSSYNNKVEHFGGEKLGIETTMWPIYSIILGAGTALFGAIEAGTVKYYEIIDGWKISVRTGVFSSK